MRSLVKTRWVAVVAIVVAGCGEGGPPAQSKVEAGYVEGKRLAEARRYAEAIIRVPASA